MKNCTEPYRFNDRRVFIKNTISLAISVPILPSISACGGGASGGADTGNSSGKTYSAVGEEHTHLATYMAFASDADFIWEQPSTENAGLDRVRADLVDVAKAIGTYEPVKMLVLSEAEKAEAQELIDTASAANASVHASYTSRTPSVGGIELIVVANGFNDYWTRDTGPVFVKGSDGKLAAAINFNFNGWGNANSANSSAPATSNKTKTASFYQAYANDRKVAAYIAARHGAAVVTSTLTLEGGAVETDGEGTAILTTSAILHPNRNPQLFDLAKSGNRVTGATLRSDAKTTVEAELKRTLGITKTIWLTGTATFPGVAVSAETDITNGHVDFYAKFIAPGVVAYASDPADATGEKSLMETHKSELTGQKDAKDRTLTLVELKAPESYGATLSNSQRANFAAGYLNLYLCNNAVILPKFGDGVADAAAVAAITPYKGSRTIVQVDIEGIASGGGGLHCATIQVPAV